MRRGGGSTGGAFGALLVIVAGAACTVEPATIVIEPLRLINWQPDGGAFCIQPTAMIFTTFSDDLDSTSLTSESLSLSDADGQVATEISYDPATFTASLVPIEPLRYDRLYTAVATRDIRGKGRGRLPVQLSTSFKTISRHGCATATLECELPSDCPGTQICANTGRCIDECATDKDCVSGICQQGSCADG